MIQENKRKGNSKPRRKKLLLILFCCLISWFLLSALRSCTAPAEWGEGVEWRKGFPPGARNISYYRSYGFSAYEYSLSREDFQKHFSEDLQKIETPISVKRYNWNWLLKVDPKTQIRPAAAEPGLLDSRAEVKNGFFRRQRSTNGGGSDFVYDLDREKCYWAAWPR